MTPRHRHQSTGSYTLSITPELVFQPEDRAPILDACLKMLLRRRDEGVWWCKVSRGWVRGEFASVSPKAPPHTAVTVMMMMPTVYNTIYIVDYLYTDIDTPST